MEDAEKGLEKKIEKSEKRDWKFYIKREAKIFYHIFREGILHPRGAKKLIDPNTGNIISDEEREPYKHYIRI